MREKILFGLALSASLGAYGCGNDNNTPLTFPDATVLDAAAGDAMTTDASDGGRDGGTTDGGRDGGADAGTPPPPTLGDQIDRMGRPAINTALTDPFDTSADIKDSRKDAYNIAKPDSWSTFETQFEKNLAIFDGLDRVCGNQLLAVATATSAEGRYDKLATVLTDDRLYLNTGSSTCTRYLGVELATQTSTRADCGGRAPTYDVIDVTYSELVLGRTSSISDGVASDTTFLPAFPFLAAPNTAQ